MALASEQYPHSALRSLLYDLKFEFYNANPDAVNTIIDSHSMDSKFINVIAMKYGQPQKIIEADEKLKEVQLQMQETIKNAIANKEKMKV